MQEISIVLISVLALSKNLTDWAKLFQDKNACKSLIGIAAVVTLLFFIQLIPSGAVVKDTSTVLVDTAKSVSQISEMAPIIHKFRSQPKADESRDFPKRDISLWIKQAKELPGEQNVYFRELAIYDSLPASCKKLDLSNIENTHTKIQLLDSFFQNNLKIIL